MNRLQELNKLISDANTEIREIREKYRNEDNTKNIGKCFADYVDDGNNHMDYYIILKVNTHGDMKANKLFVWEERKHTGKVLFQKDVFIDDWVINQSNISVEKFIEKWNDCLIDMEFNE